MSTATDIHERKCWDCGNVAEHESRIAPEVCCKKCGSQDTRATKKAGKFPPIPGELWMLWMADVERFVLSIDDAPGGETYLTCLSEREAIEAAKHQGNLFDIDCVPVRVK